MRAKILLGTWFALLVLPACGTTGAPGTVEGERRRMAQAQQAAQQSELPPAETQPVRGSDEDKKPDGGNGSQQPDRSATPPEQPTTRPGQPTAPSQQPTTPQQPERSPN
jgi:hypothetical protein